MTQEQKDNEQAKQEDQAAMGQSGLQSVCTRLHGTPYAVQDRERYVAVPRSVSSAAAAARFSCSS
jgi:hypothetical protein